MTIQYINRRKVNICEVCFKTMFNRKANAKYCKECYENKKRNSCKLRARKNNEK